MGSSNPWLVHLKKTWARTKPQGKSYRETMIIAKKSYTKKGKASKGAVEAPKRKRRRRKKKAQ